jgi:hypothetical protein
VWCRGRRGARGAGSARGAVPAERQGSPAVVRTTAGDPTVRAQQQGCGDHPSAHPVHAPVRGSASACVSRRATVASRDEGASSPVSGPHNCLRLHTGRESGPVGSLRQPSVIMTKSLRETKMLRSKRVIHGCAASVDPELIEATFAKLAADLAPVCHRPHRMTQRHITIYDWSASKAKCYVLACICQPRPPMVLHCTAAALRRRWCCRAGCGCGRPACRLGWSWWWCRPG